MNKKLLFVVAFSLFSIAAFSQADKKEYVGLYKFPEGSVVPTITVAMEDSVLMMNSSAGASPLTYDKADSFVIVNFNGIAAFKRNAENKINAVHIEAMGYILDGTKDDTGKWNFTSYQKIDMINSKEDDNNVTTKK